MVYGVVNVNVGIVEWFVVLVMSLYVFCVDVGNGLELFNGWYLGNCCFCFDFMFKMCFGMMKLKMMVCE